MDTKSPNRPYVAKLMAYEKFYDIDGNLNITPEGYDDLKSLADIVWHKHFYLNRDVKEDLIQASILAAIDKLKSGQFDPSKGQLKNFLYTLMRNTQKNFTYREFRAVPVDDFSPVPGESYSPLKSIPETLFDRYCNPVEKDILKEEFRELGFTVSGNRPSSQATNQVDSIRLNIISTIIMYKIFNGEQY